MTSLISQYRFEFKGRQRSFIGSDYMKAGRKVSFVLADIIVKIELLRFIFHLIEMGGGWGWGANSFRLYWKFQVIHYQIAFLKAYMFRGVEVWEGVEIVFADD